MSGLELYDLAGCPYCAKVRRALDDLGLDYERHNVASVGRDAVYDVSGQTGVPVLVDREHGIEGMPESDDIVRYLYETYGDGEYEPPSSLLSRLVSRFS